ncbi:glycosyltransferase family 4 protein [Solirubrobacter sp. CPCC 204708]|uniref:Glycosyltransferase family 4 protein n=1 Tax=Solirubrobacter deserti TaxID=2282478 RepID=A0ABT4RN41_9ACTN|nr:glycosyltransferase family 4 protein [Solirubrobacter deserti]MBE2317394.1 glycosyltransferase family 4 protein [Solirubrobacter deserti]MDA0139976.1 glycosyltransferase family 4 protein [Solirubrobacter deserti]
MILLLHHRYRHVGGEERAVADLQWLIREHLHEDAEVLERDSSRVGARDAALGLLRGGLNPQEVADAVKRTNARVVHAHNVNPTFGWRALAAARQAGARVVLHLHNYRLVCAQATCFTRGEDCTRCHGRNTLPGVRLNCRGGSRAESAAYAAGLALHQKRLTGAADEILVPSTFALQRLQELGAPLRGKARVLGSVQREFVDHSTAQHGEFVLAAGRLTPEKGFEDVIHACRRVNLPLVIAGDGPQRHELEARGGATFLGHVPPAELQVLRRRAAVAVVPSRYAEILPLAALESMAAAVPTVAAASGGLKEAVPEEGLYPAGDVAALADRLQALWQDQAAGERALAGAKARSAPAFVAEQLRSVYGATSTPARY